MTDYSTQIARELTIRPQQAQAVIRLLAEKATIPFIARYRKEATGSLDEVTVTAIRDRLQALQILDQRRASIRNALEERGLLDSQHSQALEKASTLAALEDLYLPYRPKRRTRAQVAREKGLEPLALSLLQQKGKNPAILAVNYISSEKDVSDVETALAGARDILAERCTEHPAIRERMRALFRKQGLLRSRVVSRKQQDEDAAKFRDYFLWEEPVDKVPSHRVLAMFRGEEEGILRLSLRPHDEESAQSILERLFIRSNTPESNQIRTALRDGYARLLAPALENELRAELKQRADTEAIRIFSDNLRQILLAPPLGAKRIMGVDPGFRTGCKVVCLDNSGRLLEYTTINPHSGSEKTRQEAEQSLLHLVRTHAIEAIAVGNGTAGRETERFLRNIPNWPNIPIIMVNESGASVYSASELARAEFPDLDLTYRSAISIGRRLADPLAELIKIDPRSIGVGQYQHDVNQAALRRSLNDVVDSCVNAVGVDVNTASEQLLTHVSGLGATLAHNIVMYRQENGPFRNRRELLAVPRLGLGAFEQCSGFLRIKDGNQPLDASAVHPEAYSVVEAMARDLHTTVIELMHNASLRRSIELSRYVDERFGIPSLTDIMAELEKPGRDPRPPLTAFAFSDHIHSLQDLRPGMILPGIVTNITAFGAFVDIGVHQDGLVHISRLADHFVKNPSEIVRVHQEVHVTVLEVDMQRKRISLSMRHQDQP